MRKINSIKIIVCVFWAMVVGCTSPRLPEAVEKRLSTARQGEEFKEVWEKLPKEQKKGAEFLLQYMTQRDLDSLSMSVFSDNLKYSYLAKNEFIWAKSAPDSIYHNFVLPYVNLTETRDNWRPEFYKIFSPLVKSAKSGKEAILIINKDIEKILGVSYNTKRPRTDISPNEAIACSMATCSGLSILLIDAFRSVGIPARFAGINNWVSGEGNHSWVEVWIDGQWHFTEYYPDKKGLDHSWFTARSSQADPDSREHSIYAVSYKPTGESFPLVWDTNNTDYHAINVTHRYLNQDETPTAIEDGKVEVKVLCYNQEACSPNYEKSLGQREETEVTVWQGEEKIASGKTAKATDDANDYLVFSLSPDTDYTLRYQNEKGEEKEESISLSDKKKEIVIFY